MTLLQDLTLKKIQEQITNKQRINVSKAMKDAGYTKQTSVSGQQYERIRRKVKKEFGWSSEECKQEIEQAKKKFIKDNDNTNYARMIELKSKISIPELRKQEITQTNPDKIIIAYGNKQSPTENVKENIISDDK